MLLTNDLVLGNVPFAQTIAHQFLANARSSAHAVAQHSFSDRAVHTVAEEIRALSPALQTNCVLFLVITTVARDRLTGRCDQSSELKVLCKISSYLPEILLQRDHQHACDENIDGESREDFKCETRCANFLVWDETREFIDHARKHDGEMHNFTSFTIRLRLIWDFNLQKMIICERVCWNVECLQKFCESWKCPVKYEKSAGILSFVHNFCLFSIQSVNRFTKYRICKLSKKSEV